jgi:cell division protein FtsN
MTAKKSTRKPVRRNSRKQPLPGWLWMLFGLALGLSVALAIFLSDQRRQSTQLTAGEPPAATPAARSAEPVAKPAQRSEEPKYSFYEMLPKFEVVIPEQERQVRADTEAVAEQRPGVYVLQAGSFTAQADADKRRAQLALQGIESTIQRVSIDDKTYHRVRIGPIKDLDRLNTLRSRLRAARIEVLVIRLGD